MVKIFIDPLVSFPKAAVEQFEVTPSSLENVVLNLDKWEASGTLNVEIKIKLPSLNGQITVSAKVGDKKVSLFSDEERSFSALMPNSTVTLEFDWKLEGKGIISQILRDKTFQENWEYTNDAGTAGKSKIPVRIKGTVTELEFSQKFDEQATIPIEIIKIIFPVTAKGKSIEWKCANNYDVVDGMWYPRDHPNLNVRYLYASGEDLQIAGWNVSVEIPGTYELYLELIWNKNSGKSQVIIRNPQGELIFQSKLIDHYYRYDDKLIEFRVNRQGGGTNFNLPEEGTYRFALINKKKWQNASSGGNSLLVHKFTLKGVK